jgi:hypothetical protein
VIDIIQNLLSFNLKADAKAFDLTPLLNAFDNLGNDLKATLNERLPAKSKNASTMSKGDYDLIGVGQMRHPYDLEWIENFPEFKTRLSEIVTKLLTDILSVIIAPSDEKKIRTYLDPFFIDIGGRIGGSLSKEVQYQINFEINSNITWPVTGKIDQVMYAQGTNFPVLPIEAKSIRINLIDGYHSAVAQAISGVNAMRERLHRFENYSPPHYCGILTNGSEWILLRLDLHNHQPFYYQDPTISAFEKGVDGALRISENGKTSIFRLLIHALGVARRHISWIRDLQQVPDQPPHPVEDDRKPDGGDGDGGGDGPGGKEKKDGQGKSRKPRPRRKGKSNKSSSEKENPPSSQGKSNHTCENIQEWTGPVLSSRNLNRCGINELRSIQRLDSLNRDRLVM